MILKNKIFLEKVALYDTTCLCDVGILETVGVCKPSSNIAQPKKTHYTRSIQRFTLYVHTQHSNICSVSFKRGFKSIS